MKIAAVLGLVAAVGAGLVNVGIAQFAALPAGASVEAAGAGGGDMASATPSAPPRQSAAMSKAQYINGILGRNIFDHTAIGQSTSSEGGEGTVTDLAYTLLSTLVSSDNRYSVATIVADAPNSFPANFGIGYKLQDATIIMIEKRKVTLRRGNNSIEYLVVEDGKTPAPRSSGGSKGGDEDSISKDGENSYTVDRSLIDKYLADLDSLGRMGRAIPHRGPDGQIDGYRLSGIRRNSLGEKLGIRNGDIVHAVNGQALTSMQGAMSAYTSLQNESSFSFEVTRRGQKMKLDYSVQ